MQHHTDGLALAERRARGDDPPEKRSPGAGSTGAMSFAGDTRKNSRERVKAQRRKATGTLAVVHGEDGDRSVVVKGRIRWMLERLIEAGATGFTAADAPAGTRVSHYILRLRQEGISVSTEYEPHGGDFSGRHARYRLECKVSLCEPVELREAAA